MGKAIGAAAVKVTLPRRALAGLLGAAAGPGRLMSATPSTRIFNPFTGVRRHPATWRAISTRHPFRRIIDTHVPPSRVERHPMTWRTLFGRPCAAALSVGVDVGSAAAFGDVKAFIPPGYDINQAGGSRSNAFSHGPSS